MNETDLTVELFGHTDAGNRALWKDDQDLRPLSELGRRQAECLAEALAVRSFDALYSSPALRCRMSLEPLSQRFGLAVRTHEGLREANGYPAPAGLDHVPTAAYGGAFVAGRALAALDEILGAHPTGRVAVCTHGDTLPALLALSAGRYNLGSRARRPVASAFGMRHTLSFRAGGLDIECHEAPDGYPLRES